MKVAVKRFQTDRSTLIVRGKNNSRERRNRREFFQFSKRLITCDRKCVWNPPKQLREGRENFRNSHRRCGNVNWNNQQAPVSQGHDGHSLRPVDLARDLLCIPWTTVITKLHDGNRGGERIVLELKRSFKTRVQAVYGGHGFSRLGLGSDVVWMLTFFSKLYFVSTLYCIWKVVWKVL